ncbi:VOC family protein [Streptomyces buecherae]|uniref:VOC family protein n=1 Tax=Streptomyces buecherae TaxID=2763006 RepID=UPI001C25FF82|nr:VOC family protein [Streptomyces buecherae]
MAVFPEGVPCWVDVALPDVAAGKRFYGELLGWTFGPAAPDYGSYTQAFHGGRNVAALVAKPDGRMPTAWNVYLATADVFGTAVRARAAGGTVIMDPVRVGDFGTMAVIADPGGAVFNLWQAGSHAGFEEQGQPGSYGWAEVYTRAPERVDAFYEDVFGLRAEVDDEAGRPDFVRWVPRGRPAGARHAVSGRGLISSGYPEEMPAHFLTYFVVEDCDAAVAATGRLGGRVAIDPVTTPHGRSAVVVDNQGASFAVIDTRTRGDTPHPEGPPA